MSITNIIVLALYLFFGIGYVYDIYNPKKSDPTRAYIEKDDEKLGGIMIYILFLPIVILFEIFYKKKK